jgi:hypothetical protein
LATLPKPLAVLRLQFRLADPIRKTWLKVTKQYNLEAADRKRPTGTGNGIGFALLSRTQKKGEISNFRKRNAAHEECWNCHKTGHFARDCWAPKNDANNKKFEQFERRLRRHKPKNYRQENASLDKGDAMATQRRQALTRQSSPLPGRRATRMLG